MNYRRRTISLQIRGGCFAAYLILLSSGSQADPTSQAEVDRQFPLPQTFGGFDLFSARTLAQQAVPVIDAALMDYPSARFKNVRAVLQADWRSWKHFYYFCGQINGKNRMGAYIGWRISWSPITARRRQISPMKGKLTQRF
jgi:hypothetical protein